MAASLRGLSLRRWRYGPETERLIAEAFEREHWSAEQWKLWQQKRLADVLERAATLVPYYREYWLQRRRRGDQSSWEVLENWPILKKEVLRENPLGFVADDCDVRRMYREHTSGTTGKPLNLWWTRQTVRAWYALFEARVRMWHGVSRNDNWAILGGQLVTPFRQSQPPFWVWNATSHQLYMSSYHLSPDYIPAYLEACASTVWNIFWDTLQRCMHWLKSSFSTSSMLQHYASRSATPSRFTNTNARPSPKLSNARCVILTACP